MLQWRKLCLCLLSLSLHQNKERKVFTWAKKSFENLKPMAKVTCAVSLDGIESAPESPRIARQANELQAPWLPERCWPQNEHTQRLHLAGSPKNSVTTKIQKMRIQQQIKEFCHGQTQSKEVALWAQDIFLFFLQHDQKTTEVRRPGLSPFSTQRHTKMHLFIAFVLTTGGLDLQFASVSGWSRLPKFQSLFTFKLSFQMASNTLNIISWKPSDPRNMTNSTPLMQKGEGGTCSSISTADACLAEVHFSVSWGFCQVRASTSQPNTYTLRGSSLQQRSSITNRQRTSINNW